MGRTPIDISVIVGSTQDSRFVKPKSFHSIPAISKAMGINLRAVRNAYHSKRTSIMKASGEVYTLDWKELVYLKDPRECYHCGKALTVKEKSTWFHLTRENIKKDPMTFTSLYVASKVTGISKCALRNACERTNKKVTQRKGGVC